MTAPAKLGLLALSIAALLYGVAQFAPHDQDRTFGAYTRRVCQGDQDCYDRKVLERTFKDFQAAHPVPR